MLRFFYQFGLHWERGHNIVMLCSSPPICSVALVVIVALRMLLSRSIWAEEIFAGLRDLPSYGIRGRYSPPALFSPAEALAMDAALLCFGNGAIASSLCNVPISTANSCPCIRRSSPCQRDTVPGLRSADARIHFFRYNKLHNLFNLSLSTRYRPKLTIIIVKPK